MKSKKESSTKATSFVGHLEDLRKTIFISVIALVAASIVVYIFWLDGLIEYLSGPVHSLGLEMVMIGVTEGFMVRIKVSLISGFVLALPIIIWQVLRFIMPALYPNEKKIVLPIVLSSVVMFVLGVIFSYKVVLDLALKIMLIDFAAGLTPMISYSKYLSFVMWILLPFGLIFEIPIIIQILSKIGIVNAKSLQKNRKFMLIGSFILAAVLSPGGEIITQIIMAIPIIVLYEISIIIAKISAKDNKTNEGISAEKEN